MEDYEEIINKVSNAVVSAGSTFLLNKKEIYKRKIAEEKNEQAKWVLETILRNAEIAEKNRSPLCDDTGIPHLLLEIGPDCAIPGKMLRTIKEGVAQGLRKLPGRPMAVKGEGKVRIEQSLGLYEDPGMLETAPIMIRNIDDNLIRLHILMFGGGPEIRGKTYRIFHKHNVRNVIDEIVSWATEGVSLLGCTPCTIAVGVGRSHYEATAMMLQALIEGDYGVQSELEQEVTERINQSGIGPIGLGGAATVLGTFIKISAQRASGVRIVCMRPCCCFEPRIASTIL